MSLPGSGGESASNSPSSLPSSVSAGALRKIAEGLGEDAETVEISRILELVRAVHEERVDDEGISVELDHAQVGQFLENMDRADERGHKRELLAVGGAFVFGAFFLIFILVICWLFLHYGKGEYIQPFIVPIATGTFGFLGGLGFRGYHTSAETT